MKDRVYHSISVHTQDNARWSYTDPPLATLPGNLVDMYIPDQGWPWFGWDWKAAEIRVIACEARSRYLLDCLEKGLDIHTLTARDIFGVDNPTTEQRHFAKTFRFRLNYGGDPRYCSDIPGAKSLGLSAPKMVQAANAIKSRDPDLARWWKETSAEVLRTGYIRTWRGRMRRFMTKDKKELVRQAFDYGMQAGVQDIANKVFIEITRTYGPDVVYKYGMHDSQWWGVREEVYQDIIPGIGAIVEAPVTINGVSMAFPAEYKERWPS